MADAATGMDVGQANRPAGWLLRVIAGVNQGAELRLTDGTWTIGTADDADLTFAEPELAAYHLRLSVQGGQVHCEILAPNATVGGVAAAVGAVDVLPPFVPARIGGTVFAIGPADAAWPEIVAPAPSPHPAPDTDADPATSGAANTATTNAQHAEATATASGPVPAPSGAVAPVVSADPLARRPATPLRNRRLVVLLGGVGLAILLLAGLLARLVMSDTVVPTGETAVTNQLPVVRAIVARQGLQERLMVDQPNGRVQIRGQVTTDRDRQTLATALRQAGVDADMQVVTDGEFIDMATTVLKGFGVEATPTTDGLGGITLSGFAADEGVIRKVIERLRSDVSLLRQVTDRMLTPLRARSMLERTLAASDLSDRLRVSGTGRQLAVTGRLEPAELIRWRAAETGFVSQTGGLVNLRSEILPMVTTAPKGIVLGRRPALVLEDGTWLAIGDNLGSLGQITAISARGVRIRFSGGEVDVPFVRPPNWIVEETPP